MGHVLCIAFPFASSAGPGGPSPLGPGAPGLELQREVFRLEPQGNLPHLEEPLEWRMEAPGEVSFPESG